MEPVRKLVKEYEFEEHPTTKGLFTKRFPEKRLTQYIDFRRNERGDVYAKSWEPGSPWWNRPDDLEKHAPELFGFVKRRDELLRAPPAPEIEIPPTSPVPERIEETPPAVTTYDKLIQVLGAHHVFEIYGPEGRGKTSLVYYIGLESQRAGKQVYYFDTEGKLPYDMADKLENYEYVDDLDVLASRIEELAMTGPTEGGLLIVDSIGWPLYVKYREMIKKEPGKRFTAWQDLLPPSRWAVRFARGVPGEKRGEWIRKNRNLSIFVDQPVSEIRKEEFGEYLRAFGGKLVFLPMLIAWTDRTDRVGEFALVSVKSIKYKKGQELARFRVTDRGAMIDWLV